MNNDLKRVGLIYTSEGAIDFKKSLQEVSIELNKNYNEFKLVQNQWDNSTKSVEKLVAEQNYLRGAYEAQSDKVKILKMQLAELENAEDKNVSAIKKKRNELTNAEAKLANYNNRLKEIESQLHNTGKKIEEFGEKVEKVGSKIENSGKSFSKFSAATASAFVATAKTAIDFEDAFTGVEKTVDGTEKQMAELKQGIRDMAKEIPSSTTEIAGVAEAAGQLGIKTENILSFSKAMIDLGNSTNLSADQAASSLAKFANIMQMSQTDFDRLGSSIVDLGNHFATTEADIVDMSMRLAGAGKQVGLSEGQVLGLATALSSVGIEAEMGGSAISKTMVNMQNAVEQSGTKLNKVLKKSGKSLRDLELLSENNSKDFKKMCDSIGMTSTEVKNLIKAGNNLEDFARISGMSAEEFKKSWKEDAVGALTAFIKGLGDAESKGESAITMLSEMGLTEVRLRDSLLRAANAGDLFSDAINTGTKAWENNTALTNEANKRYDTLKSKLVILVNNAKDLAITFGNKLMPVIEKGSDYIKKLTDKVGSLNDEQVDFILKCGKAVIAIGPLLTVIGKITSVGGTAIKTIGTFTQAIGVMKGTVATSSAVVNGLAGVIGTISSPVGLATLAIGGLITAFSAHEIALKKERESLGGLKDIIDEQNSSWNQLAKTRNETLSNDITEIEHCKKISKELQDITDENGKVKEGYELRAEVILNDLNSALGTEYQLNDNIISQYQELKSNVDKVIASKKAEAFLNSYQAEYEEALKKQAEATDAFIKLKQQLNEINEKIANSSGKERAEYELTRKTISDGLNEQSSLLTNYGKTIQDYENLQKASIEGTTETIEEACKNISTSYQKVTEDTKSSIDIQIKNQIDYVKELKESLIEAKNNNNEYQENILKSQLESSNEQLENLKQSLVNQTKTVSQLSPEQIEAYKLLAKNSVIEYSSALSQLSESTKKKIEEATGVISLNMTLKDSAGNLAEMTSLNFADRLKITDEMRNEITDSSNILNNDISIPNAAGGLINKTEERIRSNNSSAWGSDMVIGLGNGIKSQTNSSWFNGVLNGLAGKISSYIHFSRPDVGPLHDYEKWMPDMIDGLGKSLEKSSPKLINSVKNMSEEMSNELKEIGGNVNATINYEIIGKSIANELGEIINYDKLTECFTKAILKMGIYLDKGTIAGEITDNVSQNMARVKMLEERGG